MESIGYGEVIGIGGVAVGFGWIVLKMWTEHTALTKLVIGVVEKDATSKQELSSALKANTQESRENRDVLSKLLLETVKNQQHNGT